jgi:hypothetical protein
MAEMYAGLQHIAHAYLCHRKFLGLSLHIPPNAQPHFS